MMYEELTAYEKWMVRSNLDTIRETGVTVAEQVAILRANGYPRIAEAVQEKYDGLHAKGDESAKHGS